MIVRETPCIDRFGKRRDDLVRIYSDLGCRLIQVETGVRYEDVVYDSVSVYHEYTECLDELGEIPEELKEEAPVEAEDADEVEKVETEEDSAIGSGTISEA